MPCLNSSSSHTMADERHIMHQYQDRDGHFSLVRYFSSSSLSIYSDPQPRNFRLADLVTIMNGVCGSFSIFSSARYLVTHDSDYLWMALSFPLAGLMFDFLDGKVARWRKSTSLLGQELDSLADLVRPAFFPPPFSCYLILTINLRSHSVLRRRCWHLSSACGPTLTPSYLRGSSVAVSLG
jgi:hypothetical protein